MGVRGPRGGYELARGGVTASDILRAAGTAHEAETGPSSELIEKVVRPILSTAEREFGQALSRISLDEIVKQVRIGKLPPFDLKNLSADDLAVLCVRPGP